MTSHFFIEGTWYFKSILLVSIWNITYAVIMLDMPECLSRNLTRTAEQKKKNCMGILLLFKQVRVQHTKGPLYEI